MAQSVTRKILEAHLVSGKLEPGQEIGLSVDQTLLQDATGTMACLEFEAMNIPQVRTKLSVVYVDHNMLQTGFENADDHRFLQTIAARHGMYFSRPGNGICHQVHMERFAVPGRVLLGADSHTPNAGCLAMLAIGAGGLEVAVAMGGGPFYIPMPKVVQVYLKGKLQPWVAAKDIALELLRRLTVKGGIGKVFEYSGPGVDSLTVPERATICNMGAELGATTSVFPSDEQTRLYMTRQKREHQWAPLAADPGAQYDGTIEIDLDKLEPLIACPSSPDNVVPVHQVAGTPVAQVAIGSCNNSSFHDLAVVAAVVKGKRVGPGVSLVVTPGSRQALQMATSYGFLMTFVQAGARILESACGPCIGMGQAPPSEGVSIRTFNRNFPGRSGTPNDRVYLCSPEVAAACALAGKIADPRELGAYPQIKEPEEFIIDDAMVLPPSKDGAQVQVLRGPNIKPLPAAQPPGQETRGRVLIKVGDNITTDHIMPAGASILPLRSNVPAISQHVFGRVDKEFVKRCQEWHGGVIVGGVNYGQGSSREHAALAPMYLGVRAVLVKSFARIHWANLINFAILPLTFVNEKDYDTLEQGDELEVLNLRQQVRQGRRVKVTNKTKGTTIETEHQMTERQVAIYLAGGLLNHVKQQASAAAPAS
ncbi:MAG: aconitate hydratase [Chloroflexi bacterium]|nr:aconitate hydratase [Chloroflexota bacterium]